MRFGGVPNPRETIVMTRLVGSFGGAVFFGHKKPAERIGGARAVLPRKIFELGAGTRSRLHRRAHAPDRRRSAIDLDGRVLKLKANEAPNEAPPQTGEVYGRVQSG
jgi:hypothetical protein